VGFASHEGKAWAVQNLLELERKPEHFLDIGAGAGSWMEAVRPWFLESKWLAIEVWEPYVKQFCLWERYKFVATADARYTPFPQVDVCILGDVLEHMSESDSIDVWNKARAAARQAVIMSSPVVHYEQGHVHGNPFQEHLQPDLNVATILKNYDGITNFVKGETVGTFWAPGLA
jgi:hypothetical protein